MLEHVGMQLLCKNMIKCVPYKNRSGCSCNALCLFILQKRSHSTNKNSEDSTGALPFHWERKLNENRHIQTKHHASPEATPQTRRRLCHSTSWSRHPITRPRVSTPAYKPRRMHPISPGPCTRRANDCVAWATKADTLHHKGDLRSHHSDFHTGPKAAHPMNQHLYHPSCQSSHHASQRHTHQPSQRQQCRRTHAPDARFNQSRNLRFHLENSRFKWQGRWRGSTKMPPRRATMSKDAIIWSQC